MRTKLKSSTVIANANKHFARFRLPTHRAPTAPGEMLLVEFLKPMRISQSAFAVRLGVSFPRLNEIINGKRAVTADTALRLARVLGTSADFWLNLQASVDMWRALQGVGGKAILALRPLTRPTSRARATD